MLTIHTLKSASKVGSYYQGDNRYEKETQIAEISF